MEQLKDGQFGMYYSGTWELPIFSDENGELLDNIGMFQLPLTGEGDVNGFADSFSNGGAPMFISSEAAKEEEMTRRAAHSSGVRLPSVKFGVSLKRTSDVATSTTTSQHLA